MTTLDTIRTKIRRLVASPSASQLSDSQIDFYINTFYLDDLPQYLKIFDLKTVYTFYTEPNIDKYPLNINPSFVSAATKAYYSVEPPVYIAGYESYYTQDRTEFFRLYSYINYENTVSGNNTLGPYDIQITNVPVIRNQVTISAKDSLGINLIVADDGSGGFTGDVLAGSIDYVTGSITGLQFTNSIPNSELITIQSVPYVANKPKTILFFDNTFIVRPIPDNTYKIDINACIYPTVLLNVDDSPSPQNLWQLLAYGAAQKVLEDRGNTENDQIMSQKLAAQLILCNRKTLEQNRPVRASTIYTSYDYPYGNMKQF